MESVIDEDIPKINVLDAIHYVSIAWDEIKPEVIKNCFNKAYFGNVSQEDPHVLDSDEFQDFEEVLLYSKCLNIDMRFLYLYKFNFINTILIVYDPSNF